ncbi:Hypothetical Protein FCC1311_016792 [Hondaea fermentalgiana]|uniref:GDP-fucose protein O-fucosyltransferase 2 n=1 Tax=Hondaea fermentalgiana TaxID=2315210 RepID=A0A2R5GBF4_9STRA|nr:Hypothetical Protein FCC1311_016792 [Hondaea fermentalgiana]|eukprot:GBG25461.1 Hypothetical Protein FCC1311_016792 [Hondaea fermentalgiana]
MSRKGLLLGICAFCLTMTWRAWLLGGALSDALNKDNELPGLESAYDPANTGGLRSSNLRYPVDETHKLTMGHHRDDDGEDDLREEDDDEPGFEEERDEEDGEDLEAGASPDLTEDFLLPAQQKLSVLVTKNSIERLGEREALAKAKMQNHNDFVTMWSSKSEPAAKPVKNLAIERHFTHASWYKPGEKYFVYQPSGGMSNQRIILEQALLVAKALGRTLVVPPVCPHTSMFWNYNKVTWERTVQAFHVFDEVRMNKAVRTLGLRHIILRRFVEFNEKREFPKWHRVELPYKNSERDAPYTTQDLQRLYGDDPSEVLFFAKYSMWKRFNFTDDEAEYAQSHVQLAPDFRMVARLATEGLFGTQPFNSVHVRFQDRDSALLTDKLGPATSFVKRLLKYNATEISPRLYIATQPSRAASTYFEHFRKAGFELYFSRALAEVPAVGRFLSQFPQNDIQMSLLGILEQLICARSSLYLGTGFSTFSRYIRIKRINPVLFYDMSLLPMRYQEDVEFLQNSQTADIARALQKVKVRNLAADHELALLTREVSCSREVVSLVPC